jgi:SAM-dependent methyltransferase
LEIGAGTGGLASQVLPLIERGLHSYVFSDVSAAFFPGARQKLAAFPEVEYKIFDLEKPGTEQEFEAGMFDIILGTNVVHAVSDVRVALSNIHDLLAPGGSLLFVDVATPHLWLNAVFGLTSGWWRFTDRDLRPNHPLLQRSQWEKALHDSGFSETASLSGLVRSQGGEASLASWRARHGSSRRWRKRSGDACGKIMACVCGCVRLGDQLAAQLRASGVRCRVAHRGSSFTTEGTDAFTLRAEVPEDWKELLETCADEAQSVSSFLWSWMSPSLARARRSLVRHRCFVPSCPRRSKR